MFFVISSFIYIFPRFQYGPGMARGPLTNVEILAQQLLRRWIPKWYGAFYDPAQGNFYERLGKGFRPVLTGQRRLLTQCRQLATYSHASRHSAAFAPDLQRHFQSLRSQYFLPETGGWRFSVTDEGRPKDETYDLYTLAFVIFALAHYYRATGDGEAKGLAKRTLDFIATKFALPGQPGFAEALDKNLAPIAQVRRQNPHMHLLEACLFAGETWEDDPAFSEMADRMVLLFTRFFYDANKGTLHEFFSDDLTPHPEKGHVLEPGHHFEWIWLLKKHAAAKGERKLHDDVCVCLLEWANAHGWDAAYGGIFDEVAEDGTVLSETKRIWPFTESLKANALMLDGMERQTIKDRIADMVQVFRRSYMQERGFWTERLSCDLLPVTDFMPGTTPYHVYFGIMETRDILRERGSTVSFVPALYAGAYALRRKLSQVVTAARQMAKDVAC
jgi:mannose/cellobiose epimerase-like protein (N-acyl-D-glucosamine 2-epimerase family)